MTVFLLREGSLIYLLSRDNENYHKLDRNRDTSFGL